MILQSIWTWSAPVTTKSWFVKLDYTICYLFCHLLHPDQRPHGTKCPCCCRVPSRLSTFITSIFLLTVASSSTSKQMPVCTETMYVQPRHDWRLARSGIFVIGQTLQLLAKPAHVVKQSAALAAANDQRTKCHRDTRLQQEL